MDYLLTQLEYIDLYVVAFLAAALLFSFFLSRSIFQELDYYEIKYTPRTKRRAVWIIYSNLLFITLWFNILNRLFSKIYPS